MPGRLRIIKSDEVTQPQASTMLCAYQSLQLHGALPSVLMTAAREHKTAVNVVHIIFLARSYAVADELD